MRRLHINVIGRVANNTIRVSNFGASGLGKVVRAADFPTPSYPAKLIEGIATFS